MSELLKEVQSIKNKLHYHSFNNNKQFDNFMELVSYVFQALDTMEHIAHQVDKLTTVQPDTEAPKKFVGTFEEVMAEHERRVLSPTPEEAINDLLMDNFVPIRWQGWMDMYETVHSGDDSKLKQYERVVDFIDEHSRSHGFTTGEIVAIVLADMHDLYTEYVEACAIAYPKPDTEADSAWSNIEPIECTLDGWLQENEAYYIGLDDSAIDLGFPSRLANSYRIFNYDSHDRGAQAEYLVQQGKLQFVEDDKYSRYYRVIEDTEADSEDASILLGAYQSTTLENEVLLFLGTWHKTHGHSKIGKATARKLAQGLDAGFDVLVLHALENDYVSAYNGYRITDKGRALLNQNVAEK